MAKRSKIKERKKKNNKTKLEQQAPVSDRTMSYGVTEDKDVLLVGLDLGTARTKISASNGVRKTVASIVGYPKDIIAEKFLRKSILFGSEALKNRLSLDLYTPISRGVVPPLKGKATSEKKQLFQENLAAARELFEYAVDLTEPKAEQQIFGVICTPAEITEEQKELFASLARDVLDAYYFVPTPFAVAYGIDELNSLIVDIGGETVDYCRVYGTIPSPVDLHTSYKAGAYIDEQLLELMSKKEKGAQLTYEMVQRWKEEYGFVLKAKEHIEVEFPVNGVPKREVITDELQNASRSIIPEIVTNLQQLIATFDPEFQAEIRNNILLAGGTNQLRELSRAIQAELEAMRCRVRGVPDPMFRGADGALKFGQDLPVNAWQHFS